MLLITFGKGTTPEVLAELGDDVTIIDVDRYFDKGGGRRGETGGGQQRPWPAADEQGYETDETKAVDIELRQGVLPELISLAAHECPSLQNYTLSVPL